MVATIETTSESGPWPVVPRCRVAATYPQGGTGIPAGTTNYPGAAAHMQPAAATGFRAVDVTSGFGLSPNALNINGADTYQFVGSDPVGRVDATGTAVAGIDVMKYARPGGNTGQPSCPAGTPAEHENRDFQDRS